MGRRICTHRRANEPLSVICMRLKQFAGRLLFDDVRSNHVTLGDDGVVAEAGD